MPGPVLLIPVAAGDGPDPPGPLCFRPPDRRPGHAGEDPWAAGCPGCTEIDRPPWMAVMIAGFAAAAKREGITAGLVGPACRAIETGDWSICRHALADGCGHLDISGQHGAVSIMSLGVLVTPV